MRNLILITVLTLLSGCAAQKTFNEGRALIETGHTEAGLAKVEEASRLDPGSLAYRQYYFDQRALSVQRLLAQSEAARIQAQWDEAEGLYRRVLAIEPVNSRATSGLEAMRTERRHQGKLVQAEALLKKGESALAQALVREVLTENGNHRQAQSLSRRVEEETRKASAAAPQLSATLRRPIDIEFTDTPLKTVFELISKTTGMNFLFDRDVRADLRTTIFVKNTSIEDVLRFLLVTNQLERKVLNTNTLLIYPNTSAKLRDYQDLVVKSFYLANADVKQTAAMIRSLVKTKDLHIDERLNLLVIRDTPDAIRMAERLVANQDLADAEVMLEVEILEVASNVLSDLGIQWPSQVGFSLVGAAGTAGSLTLPEWQNRNSDLVRLSVSNPFLLVNLKKQNGSTNVLANPRIRVKNKDKAKIHIGDKVPVITTTTTATGFASESVTYLDVGLKLDVEPIVSLDEEVGIKVSLEVSNIVREVRSLSGSLTYQVGTRNAATNLRLKDGETQVLAGLISDEDRRTVSKVPGLGDLPGLGRLFGSENRNSVKSEVVLLITPHILRNLARPEFRFEEFSSGTEAVIGAAPLVFQNLVIEEAAGAASAAPRPLSAAPLPASLGLLAPASVPAGEEFTVRVQLNGGPPIRSGLLDLAFDPSRLKFLRAETGTLLQKNASIRASAPEGLGRLSLSLSGESQAPGTGELARLTFQALPGMLGTPSVRLEAASLTDSAGKVLAGQIPPPLSISLVK